MSEVANYVRAHLSSSRRPYKKNYKRKFYVSDMGKCHRMRWLKRKGISSRFDSYVLWIMKLGDLCHDFVYVALEAQGRLLESEEIIENKHFKGKYDGIVKITEGKGLFDAKSAGAYKINDIAKGKEDPENIAQLLTYFVLLKDAGRDDINKAILFYMNKETSGRCPIDFEEKSYYLTSWREKKLREEMKTMVDYWEKDKIPPCTCPAWMKDYNSFQPLCQMADKDILKVLEYVKKGKEIITTKKVLYLVDGRKETEITKI